MTIIDRPTARRRATTVQAPTPRRDPAARFPLGGHYVSGAVQEQLVEGSYVSTGSPAVPATRGTYVTTSSRPARSGGSYTYMA